MYICMCVFIYVCICVSMRVYVFVCMYVCECNMMVITGILYITDFITGYIFAYALNEYYFIIYVISL